MLDDDDFPAEPEHRASDPSIEEMLRRARDARLGNTFGPADVDAPRFRPFATLESGAARSWLRDCALLVIGVLLGALVACTAVRVGTLVSSASTLQPTTQNTPATTPPAAATTTATPLPTPTDTPSPSPTAMPTATAAAIPTPPTTNEIVSLVQAFYDNDSAFAGSYVLVNITNMQLQQQDDTQLTVCVAYQVAMVASPGTVAASNTRPFTLSLASDGTWQVVQMGAGGSCSLG